MMEQNWLSDGLICNKLSIDFLSFFKPNALSINRSCNVRKMEYILEYIPLF